MMISRNVKTAVAAAAAAGCALWGSVAVATASAHAAPTDPGTTSVSVPLHFVGYDPARAAEYGYEVRTDIQGLQYAVPVGTPTGSEDGATPRFDPATGRLATAAHRESEVAGETVDGDCGSATFEFKSNTEFYTAYNLNGAFGPAVAHTWHVAIQSRIDAGSYDLGGLPPVPGASLNWATSHEWDEVADRNTNVSGVAGGTVTTVLGSCASGQPADTWTYL